ncbi:efflux RND transporter periplasmic adaptor subunit [Micromonospora sp. WMMD956]|uniref:efflux RND transporter periplasmic adaptor subunit n=1 Tax=Micromonospora sp. WMMD956 TaxID=3016108 RepID=UPI002417F4BF|nr:efflux RND transporter periplasmic adaptor subunit [Micromonospora sp. WMMD956]MDG4819276.1 efflux RND transporter periplasmic adaptor subunit [Micromonospora sp. WMMD956]
MGDGLNRRWRTRRARRVVAGGAALLLIVAGGGWLVATNADPTPARPSTVAVDRGPVAVEVATSGTVAPATTRALGFSVVGTVQTISVRPGDVVRAGQRLAAVADDDAAAAAEAVDEAEEDLTEARDALARAREDTADGAADCPTGAGVRPVVLRSATATATAPTPGASASSATASPTPTATRSTPAPTATGGRSARPSASGPTAPAPGGTCAGGGAAGAADPILQAQRRVNQAEASLAEARETLAGTTITAPIAGTVLSVAGKVGSEVDRGSTFITLADTFAMQVEARFPEADAVALAVGQQATLTLPDRPDRTFAATVVQVDPVGVSDGSLVRYGVVLSFTEAPQDLLVGQSAAVTVETAAVADAVRVPSTAVHDVAGGTGTVRVGVEGTPRTVTVGLRGGRFTEVTSGLTAGELVLRSW